MSGTPEISIVVPARNESARLPSTIERLREFMDTQPGTELVLAADVGSSDDTVAIAERMASEDPRIRVAHVPSKGKGSAVIIGMSAARGRVALMADADLSVGPDDFHRLVSVAQQGGVAIASRSVPGSQRAGEPRRRYLIGRLFNLAVRILVLPGIRDSQCGFKAFPREPGLDLLRQLRSTGWVFDIELLALARRSGLQVREVPVRWEYSHGSTVRLMGDLPAVVRELWGVRSRVGRVSRAQDRPDHSLNRPTEG